MAYADAKCCSRGLSHRGLYGYEVAAVHENEQYRPERCHHEAHRISRYIVSSHRGGSIVNPRGARIVRAPRGASAVIRCVGEARFEVG